MKKIYSIIAIFLCLCLSLNAQDARQRTIETVVADVLAAMPAHDAAALSTQMADLAAAAPASIVQVAKMMKPAGEGVKNSIFEYALTGVVNYVNDPAHKDKAADVKKGLQEAVAACPDATNKAFLQTLERMLGTYVAPVPGEGLSVKEARKLLKSGETHLKCAAARDLMKANPAKAFKIVSNALKDNDKVFRNSVLNNATSILDVAGVVPVLTSRYGKLSDDAKVDVLNWFGNNKVIAASGIVADALDGGGDVSMAAIAAAGKIGGEKLGKALVARLAGTDAAASAAALVALKSFKGDVQDEVAAALGTADNKEGLLKLAASRRMLKVAPLMFKLAKEKPEFCAYLASVATPGDVKDIAYMIDNSDKGKYDLNSLVPALNAAIHTLPPQKQYETLNGLMAAAPVKACYYTSLANTGTDEAVEALSKAYYGGDVTKRSLGGLLNIDNFKAAPVLMDIARNIDAPDKPFVLGRYIELINKYEQNVDKKRKDLSDVLDLAASLTDAEPRKSIKEKAINSLGSIPAMKSFLLAGKYLDDQEGARAAAYAVKNIAGKTTEEINFADLKNNLLKAQAILKATGDADDGYAVDEISKIMAERAEVASPVSQLTAEEVKRGFEMLFDGTSLDKWQGDFEGYTPVNGSIYVSAGYGSTGNLYTKKEYRNFVYRFEFCFLREGVNNGVGIRTPMGVDAAYDGMCECQILDHDAPMYANLHDYQVHGSAYGIIPAKRVVHKPLGEWNTEEIRVEGDRIKVTLNGEVILDGNLRTACKGRNVAPDGSSRNPYTYDNKNHPGMFNKKGHISFCGHGEGLKIRNVRILDLGD